MSSILGIQIFYLCGQSLLFTLPWKMSEWYYLTCSSTSCFFKSRDLISKISYYIIALYIYWGVLIISCLLCNHCVIYFHNYQQFLLWACIFFFQFYSKIIDIQNYKVEDVQHNDLTYIMKLVSSRFSEYPSSYTDATLKK